jgi:hypothetical protein
MISVLSLRFEAFRLSLLAFVSQVPILYGSSLKFTDRPGACRLSFERVLDAIISRSSSQNLNMSANAALLSAATSVILLELVSQLLCFKMS